MADKEDVTAFFASFEVQFGQRGDEVLMWLTNDWGESPGCHVDRTQITALRDFLDRLLAEYPPLMEETGG